MKRLIVLAVLGVLVAGAVAAQLWWLIAVAAVVLLAWWWIRRRTRLVIAYATQVYTEIGEAVDAGASVLNLAVSRNGSLFVYLGGAPGGMRLRSYILADHCPHCLIEDQMALVLPHRNLADSIDRYRQTIATNQAVEVHMIRNATWEISYFHPGRTWPVVVPMPCPIHSPLLGTDTPYRPAPARTAHPGDPDWRPPSEPSRATRQVYGDIRGVVAFCQSLGVPAELINDDNVSRAVYAAFIDVFSEGSRADTAPRPADLLSLQYGMWFGDDESQPGLFRQRLIELRDGIIPADTTQLEELQGFFAAQLAIKLIRGGNLKQRPGTLGITIGRELRCVPGTGPADWRLPLDGLVEATLALDADLATITSEIDRMIAGIGEEPVVRFFPVGRHPFVMAFAIAYMQLSCGRAAGGRQDLTDTLTQAMAENGVFVPMHDSALNITRQMVTWPRERGLDLIVRTRAGTETTAETTQLWRHCYKLLRPGGTLCVVLKSTSDDSPQAAGLVAASAQRAVGDPHGPVLTAWTRPA